MDDPYPEGMVDEIKRFLADDHKRRRGEDWYLDVFETQTFFPLQRRHELAEMMRRARQIRPRVVMEIGADKGGGLYHWAKCLPTVDRIIACEIRGCPYKTMFDRAFPHIDFLWLEDTSQDDNDAFVQGWLQTIGGISRIDILFIDGDKTKFLEDFDAYLPLMSQDGLVFMHDVQDRLPKEAYETVLARGYRGETIIDTSESLEQEVLDMQGVPPRNPYEAWLRHWKGSSCGVGVIHLASKPTDRR